MTPRCIVYDGTLLYVKWQTHKKLIHRPALTGEVYNVLWLWLYYQKWPCDTYNRMYSVQKLRTCRGQIKKYVDAYHLRPTVWHQPGTDSILGVIFHLYKRFAQQTTINLRCVGAYRLWITPFRMILSMIVTKLAYCKEVKTHYWYIAFPNPSNTFSDIRHGF